MKNITVESEHLSVEVEFTLSWQDIAQAETLFRRQVRKSTHLNRYWKLLLVIPPAAALIGATLVATAELGLLATSGALLLLLALSGAYIGYFILRHKENSALISARGQFMAKQRWRVVPQGLERNIRTGRWLIPWNSLHRLRRFGKCLALYIDDANIFLIPDRAFVSAHQMKVFVELVGKGIRNAQRRSSG